MFISIPLNSEVVALMKNSSVHMLELKSERPSMQRKRHQVWIQNWDRYILSSR